MFFRILLSIHFTIKMISGQLLDLQVTIFVLLKSDHVQLTGQHNLLEDMKKKRHFEYVSSVY